MTARETERLALLVGMRPHQHRETRAELDMALAAAAMDWTIEVHFLGSAVMQLAAARDSINAMLPPGYRGWAAVPDLSDAEFFAETDWLERCTARGIELAVPVAGLASFQMQQRWRQCDRVLAIR